MTVLSLFLRYRYIQEQLQGPKEIFGRGVPSHGALLPIGVVPFYTRQRENDNYIITCLSFNDIDIVRPAGYEVTSDDVPTGMLVIRGDDMVKVGRPDLGKTERKRLHSTVYAPYIGRFVLRQDAFETNGVIFRRAAKTPLEELKSLHDHMGGGNCSCRVMVRLNHYGTMAMLPKWKWLCQVNAESDEA